MHLKNRIIRGILLFAGTTFLAGAFTTIAAEVTNLLRNGGFDEGMIRWTGLHKFENEQGNKFATLDLNSSTQGFRQSFNSTQIKAIDISFRYKTSADFSSQGLEVRIFREAQTEDNWTWRSIKPKSNSDWTDFNWHFEDMQKDGQYYFEVKVKPGKGKISFDDFVLTPSKATGKKTTQKKAKATETDDDTF